MFTCNLEPATRCLASLPESPRCALVKDRSNNLRIVRPERFNLRAFQRAMQAHKRQPLCVVFNLQCVFSVKIREKIEKVPQTCQ